MNDNYILFLFDERLGNMSINYFCILYKLNILYFRVI